MYSKHTTTLVDQHDNTYHHFIKKPMNGGYLALTERIETNSKAPNLKLIIKSELVSIRIFLLNVTLKIGQGKFVLLILFWKLILGLINLNI